LVRILKIDIEDILAVEAERDAPVPTDIHAPRPAPVASELMESRPRKIHILWLCRGLQCRKNELQLLHMSGGNPSLAPLLKKPPEAIMPKTLDHATP
jgi:hypothetical protein